MSNPIVTRPLAQLRDSFDHATEDPIREGEVLVNLQPNELPLISKGYTPLRMNSDALYRASAQIVDLERNSSKFSPPLQRPGERHEAITMGPLIFINHPETNETRWLHREDLPEGIAKIDGNWVERRGDQIHVLPTYPEDPDRVKSMVGMVQGLSSVNPLTLAEHPDEDTVNRHVSSAQSLNQYLNDGVQQSKSLTTAETYKNDMAQNDLKLKLRFWP